MASISFGVAIVSDWDVECVVVVWAGGESRWATLVCSLLLCVLQCGTWLGWLALRQHIAGSAAGADHAPPCVGDAHPCYLSYPLHPMLSPSQSASSQ